VNAKLTEMSHGVLEIFSTQTPMAASGHHYICHLFYFKFFHMDWRLAVHYECQRRARPLGAFHPDSAWHAVWRFGCKITAKQLAQRCQWVGGIGPTENATALADPAKCHHQAMLFRPAAKTRNSKAD
jgi:hypothetical protein